MATDNLIIETEGGVSTVTLNRPEALNAFNIELLTALDQAMTQAARDEAVKVVVLTGEGRAFSAGGRPQDACSERHRRRIDRQLP